MKRTLFILALSALSLSSAHAAVGDSIDPRGKVIYHVDGVKMSTTYGTASWNYASVVQAESTRLYDSNKGGPWTGSYYDGTEYDSLMCWTHVATNSIQYWQDVYGVFYKDTGNMSATGSGSARNLPNGYCGVENIYEGGVYVDVNNARELNIAETFYKSWKNTGGSFGDAADWFFKADSTTNPWDAKGQWTNANPHPGKDNDASFSCGTPGGYYSEYFGNGNSDRDAFVTINAAAQTSAAYSTFAYNDREALKQALLAGLGFTRQDDGSYVQTQEGMLAALSLSGHVLNCYGFTTDANGTLNTVLIADGDNGTTRLQELLIKEVNGKLVLYRSSSAAYINASTYIDGVSYINTPEVLQNMLKEYRSMDEAAVWNGKGTGGIWETKVDVVDSEIADASTGWDVLVDGDNIAEEHRDYYHAYSTDGRAVVFGAHGMNGRTSTQTITVSGMVTPGAITVENGGDYHLKAGTGAAIEGTGDVAVNNGGKLSSELNFGTRAIKVASGGHFAYAMTADTVLTGQISGENGSIVQFRNGSSTHDVTYSYNMSDFRLASIKGTLVVGDATDACATKVDFSAVHNGYLEVENLVLYENASLNTVDTTVVTGTYSSLRGLQSAATFSVRAAATAPVLNDSLDLTNAHTLVMETATNLNSNELNRNKLLLSTSNILTLQMELSELEDNVLFTNVSAVTVDNLDYTTDTTWDATTFFSGENMQNYDLVFANGNVSLVYAPMVPEPTTATLSLLALAALAARRRRK